MTRPLLVAAAATVLGLSLLSGCTGSDVPAPGPAKIDVDTPQLRQMKADAGIEPCVPGTGDPVDGGLPAVTLPCLGGGEDVDLSTLRGPLILNVWGEWCGPCRKELPAIADFYRAHGDEVPVIGIDYQDTQTGPAIELAARSGVTYPQVADTQGALDAQAPFPARMLVPAFVFVAADGTATVVPGGVDSAEELAQLADEHLGTDL
ncbi:TlpA family protein disulfide reductase [Nocardioides sp.]|uniref:TlpA family protein disulfide reductase n=1 Tax=Nocardioides sp. TaxID=35761 RepID=UPI0037842D9D